MKAARTRCVPPMQGSGRRETAVGERSWIDTSWSILVTSVTVLLLSACGGHDKVTAAAVAPPPDVSELDHAEDPGAGFLAPTLIPVETYEGSGQLVHPDAAVFPNLWQGKRYWVAGTPYPFGNSKFENPSIYHGRISTELHVPTGVTNPLATAPSGAYMSDPDVVHDPDTDELRLYYRETIEGLDEVLLVTSRDGVHWTPPQLVASAARYSLISPAVVRESATSWRMWTVNASAQGCFSLEREMTLEQRQSADGITWGDPVLVTLRMPGRVPWHWDVQYIAAKSEYWALIAAYPEGTTCSRTAVYFAHSADGTNWKVAPTALLAPGDFEPMRDVVYRSSFHYHDASDAVSVWFSGARLEGSVFRYAVASARYPYPELMRRVVGASPMMLEREGSSVPSPELQAARSRFEHAFP
jgi:hypothetical protein